MPGHWEGDLLCGSANSYMVTLVERQTRYVMLAKIPSRDTHTVIKALNKQAKQLPEELYKSLTWDSPPLGGCCRGTLRSRCVGISECSASYADFRAATRGSCMRV